MLSISILINFRFFAAGCPAAIMFTRKGVGGSKLLFSYMRWWGDVWFLGEFQRAYPLILIKGHRGVPKDQLL